MKKILTTLCLATLLGAPAAADTYIGYTNTDFDRTGGVRFGTSETQGLAIKLPKEKLDMLRGKTIKGVRAVFGTRNMENLTFFVTTDLDATPAYTQSADGGTASWREFTFDTPYTIGNEDVLYIGYTLTSLTAYRPLQFDRSMELADRSFYYTGSGWADAYGQDLGCACIQLILDDAQFTDVIVKNFSANGYYLAGTPYKYNGQLFNFGTEPLTSFDVVFSMGNGEQQRYPYTGLNVGSNETFDIEFPEYTSDESGDLPIEITVENINGSGSDDEGGDNSTRADIYMYPADMQRAVLLEGFTGQSCSNCPTGHHAIEAALEQYDGDVVEVFHHIGFAPDNFTMSEETFYLNFYGSDGTYAPAFMVNRMAGESSSVPVQNVSTGTVLDMLNTASSIQPYVGIDVNTKYDESSRRVQGSVDIFTHVMPDADTTLLSLFIVQDSIVAMQMGGNDSYVHRYVYRGSLIGDFGGRIYLEKGSTISVPVDYTLPEEIVSTYFKGTYADDELPSIPVSTKDMYIVAIVGKYSVDNNMVEFPVYNVRAVKMCADNTTTGITQAPVTASSVRVSVSGNRVSIPGGCDAVAVYDMSGRMVRSYGGQTTEFTLPKGMYLVRCTKNGSPSTSKIAILK